VDSSWRDDSRAYDGELFPFHAKALQVGQLSVGSTKPCYFLKSTPTAFSRMCGVCPELCEVQQF
jgi:hypothetical protein